MITNSVNVSGDLEVSVLEIGKSRFVCILKNRVTKGSCWFCFNLLKSVEKQLSKGNRLLRLGSKRTLVLEGVKGFTSSVEGSKLKLNIGMKEIANYTLPSNLVLGSGGSKQRVSVWSLDRSKLNNFLHKVKKKTPVKKNSLCVN